MSGLGDDELVALKLGSRRRASPAYWVNGPAERLFATPQEGLNTFLPGSGAPVRTSTLIARRSSIAA